jgi:tetratricopeptide (TPR) repeat protein
VFDIHTEIKSIQVDRENIVTIIESINSPMVAAANKPLEPAKAFILGQRNPSGLFSIYVYLHLLQSKECLIYLHDPPEIPMESYHDTELEALQFVESMGFMVDNANFRNLAPEQQVALMEQLPMFVEDLEVFARQQTAWREGGEPAEEEGADAVELLDDVVELQELADAAEEQPARVRVVSPEGVAKIVKLFSSFCWLVIFTLLGCATGPTAKIIRQAEISYDLGVNEFRAGRLTEALKNFIESSRLNPEFARAHNGLGLVYHLMGDPANALAHFKKALELKPDYSEVLNNMARVYIGQNRFRLAIPLLRKALQDVFLKERYLAESNLGWSLFQVGEEDEGLKRVRNAVAQNERYCVGYEYLGLMHKSRKEYQKAIREFAELTERCPGYIAGWLNLGKVHLMTGDDGNGCAALERCRSTSRMTDLGRECERIYTTSCSPTSSPGSPGAEKSKP